MKKKPLLTVIASLSTAALLTGCAPSAMSWKTFEEKQADNNYCASVFQAPEDVERCEVERIAYLRAHNECKNDADSEYCVLMAQVGWDNMKDIVLKGKMPTRSAAENYPILCGVKEKKPVKCAEIKK